MASSPQSGDPKKVPSQNLVAALGDLYRSRGLMLGMLAAAIGIIFILGFPADDIEVSVLPDGQVVIGDESPGFWDRVQVSDIGVALFQVGLTITLFQVLLNQIAQDRFAEQVRGALGEQEASVQLAVAQSLAAGKHLERLRLSPAELDRVIESACRLRSGSPELGSVISRKLRNGVFESREIWRNLVVRAEIIGLESAAETGRQHDYYNVYFQFGYHTTDTRRTRFAFRVARWRDEYDSELRSRDMGAVWRLPSTGEFDDDWASGVTLTNVSFAGRTANIILNEAEREFVVHVPVDEFEESSSVLVQYSFMAKVLADGNLLSFEVPKPTFGATYSISIAVDDIERIRALDHFGATRPASIEYAPDIHSTRFVSVSVDDWILPKAGTVLVWKRGTPHSQ